MQGYGGDKIFRNFIDETCTSGAVVVQSSCKQTTRVQTPRPSTEALSSPSFLGQVSCNGTASAAWFSAGYF